MNIYFIFVPGVGDVIFASIRRCFSPTPSGGCGGVRMDLKVVSMTGD